MSPYREAPPAHVCKVTRDESFTCAECGAAWEYVPAEYTRSMCWGGGSATHLVKEAGWKKDGVEALGFEPPPEWDNPLTWALLYFALPLLIAAVFAAVHQ